MARSRRLLPLAALAALVSCVTPALTQTVIDEWSNVKAPQAPKLKTVKVDPKTTALMVMDLFRQTCNEQKRPRCVSSIPKIAKLIAAARAKGTMVIYTTLPLIPIADSLPEVAPKASEPVVVSFNDKFVLGDKDTGLEKMLKDKGITTVIMVGTAADGSGLYTSSAAASRGFNVIVPVDGISAESAYVEQAVAYILTHAPVVSSHTTLTRIDMINF
jgi:nicotinamidase-related amidase